MPTPSNIDDLKDLIVEKLFDNSSGLIEEHTVRETLIALSMFFDTKLGLVSPTMTEDQTRLMENLLNLKTSNFIGTISPATSIPATGDISGIAEAGTYPNAGNLTVSPNTMGILSRVGTTWSKVEVEIPPVQVDQVFNPDSTAPASQKATAEWVVNYIGDLGEIKEVEVEDLTDSTWVNGKAMYYGSIVDSPNDRYIKIPLKAGEILWVKLAAANAIASVVFIDEDGVRSEYITGVNHEVYTTDYMNPINGDVYLNQNIQAPTVEFIRKIKVSKSINNINDFVNNKFKIIDETSKIEVPLEFNIGNFIFDLNLKQAGADYHDVRDMSDFGEFAYSRLYPVFKGEIYYFTGQIGWNGVAFFDLNGKLASKKLAMTGTYVTDYPIQIDEDGFLQVSIDKSKVNILKKASIKTVSVKQLYENGGGSGGHAVFYYLEDFYEEADNGNYSLAFTRLLASLGRNGGVISLLNKDYRFDTKVIVNKPISVRGQGCSDFFFYNWGTKIYTNSPTLEIFSVEAQILATWEDIFFDNQSALLPTAGCAIRFKGKPGATLEDAMIPGYDVRRCSFRNFHDNIYADGAAQWRYVDNLNAGSVRYGLYIACTHPDAGDSCLRGNFFNTTMNRNGKAQVYWENSGGLKVSDNKFNHNAFNGRDGRFIPEYCIEGIINGDTVDFIINGNSFENYSKSAIKFEQGSRLVPSHRFRNIPISGNQFESYTANTVDINMREVKNLAIVGNTFTGINGQKHAINLNSVEDAVLMNSYYGYANPVNTYACTNVKQSVLEAAPVGTNFF